MRCESGVQLVNSSVAKLPQNQCDELVWQKPNGNSISMKLMNDFLAIFARWREREEQEQSQDKAVPEAELAALITCLRIKTAVHILLSR